MYFLYKLHIDLDTHLPLSTFRLKSSSTPDYVIVLQYTILLASHATPHPLQVLTWWLRETLCVGDGRSHLGNMGLWNARLRICENLHMAGRIHLLVL